MSVVLFVKLVGRARPLASSGAVVGRNDKGT